MMLDKFDVDFLRAWARQLVGRKALTGDQVDCIRASVCALPFSVPPLPDRGAIALRARARAMWVELAGRYEAEIGAAMLAQERGAHRAKLPNGTAAEYGGLRPFEWVLIWLDELGCLTVADVIQVVSQRLGVPIQGAVWSQFDRAVKYCVNQDWIEGFDGVRVGKRYCLTDAGRLKLKEFQLVKGVA